MHLLSGRTVTGDRLFRRDDAGSLTALADVTSVGELLRHPLAEIRALADAAGDVVDAAEVEPRSIVDGRMEVWAAGVTYKRSRTARAEESTIADVYDRVYDAERPSSSSRASRGGSSSAASRSASGRTRRSTSRSPSWRSW